MNFNNVNLRNIPDIDNRYFAGDDGCIYSNFRGNIKKLKPSKGNSGRGYYQISILYQSGVRRSRSVHDLVCSAFHGRKPNKKFTVSHIDGDKYNNKPDNLEWTSYRKNLDMRLLHGTHDSGTSNSRSLFNKEELFVIRYLLESTDMTHNEIGNLFGTRGQNISRIRSGARYGNIHVWVEESVTEDRLSEIMAVGEYNNEF